MSGEEEITREQMNELPTRFDLYAITMQLRIMMYSTRTLAATALVGQKADFFKEAENWKEHDDKLESLLNNMMTRPSQRSKNGP